MPAINQDVEHYRGDTKKINIPVKDSATGAAVNLAGGSARWWMGKGASAVDDKVLLKKSTGGQGIALTEIGGFWTAQISIVPADTQSLKPGLYYHELEVVDAAGEVFTVTTGSFTIIQTMIPSI